MSQLPQVYQKYDLFFTPRLILQLRNLRGKEWAELIDSLASLPESHPDNLAFALMMIDLGGCLPCDMDSYRAQRGCAVCARHTIMSFKGSDKQLITHYEHRRTAFYQQHASDAELQQAA